MTFGKDTTSLLFSSEECPFGYSWQYWVTKWWQWFLSIPVDNNPAVDLTGDKSSVKQNNPYVWFLAGTIYGRAERIVKIPAGKGLLLPIINMTVSKNENPELNSDTEMISYVEGHMKDIVKKRAIIDGNDVLVSEKFRVQSPPFYFNFPLNNIYNAQPGPGRGVGDGYWIFMKPPSSGIHTIKTYGSCMAGKIKIDVAIKLIIGQNPGK